MFKVRIKTSPEGGTYKSTGQQEGYGLVRNLRGMQVSPESVAVNDKMGAIPRDQANIEVEGGESVIGDVNKDGTMELMHFQGKRHTEGGVPVNIPEGSFIYSDTKSLTIKDPEVIEKIFNLPARKQGYTPAEISRKYDINVYIEILKDETSDPLAKRSAAEMLKKNKQKLGLLAFIQESMKGFPDGIPAIAEEVLSTMGIDPNQMAQQFAPQQPQQGMGMQQGAMPPMGEQGIPMSEDEDAMAGMMPEGPAVAPEDIANQMQGKFGGTMLPSYEGAGVVDFNPDPFAVYTNSVFKFQPGTQSMNLSCKPGFVYNSHIGECVTPMWKNTKEVYRIPYESFQKNHEDFVFSRGSTSAPVKKQSAADKKAQEIFDKSFKIIDKGPTNYEKSKAEQARLIEEKRKKEGYYEKASQAGTLTKKVFEGTATSEEEALLKDLNKYFLGLDPATGKFTDERQAEEDLVYSIDKKYGTLSIEQKEKQKREEKAKAEGFESYADMVTKEKTFGDAIPGFGSKDALKEYMNSGSGQFTAGDTFYKALLSNDPQQMIAAADDIKNIDVDWSLGWLPFTDQDKVDDMYSILYEQAYKILNEKEKVKIQKYYQTDDMLKKADDLITDYDKKAREAVDVKTKKQYADLAAKYKRYKQYLESPGHESWKKKVNSSKFEAEDSWLPGPGIGSVIQDEEVMPRYGYPTDFLFNETEILGINLNRDDVVEGSDSWFDGPRFKTYFEIYDEITKGHDKIKGTTVATIAPIANKGLTHTNERQGFLNYNAPEVIDNVRTINQVQNPSNSAKDAKGYAQPYKLKAAPNSIFTMGKNVDGQMVWFEETQDGAQLEVSNQAWVDSLNTAASTKEGKKVALPAAKAPMDAIQLLEQENKINPQTTVTPIKKENTTEKKTDVVAPVGRQPQPTQAKPKYEGGFTDQDFDKLFGSGGMRLGGTMPAVGSNVTIGDKVFRYGGLINENGKLRYDRGGSVLPKYPGGGTSGGGEPVTSEVKVVTDPNKNGGKPMNAYTITYKGSDGDPNHNTVVQVLEDQATGNVIVRRNETTKEAIPAGVEITRSSYDWIKADNLNASEKKEIESRWNGNTQAYLDFKNANNQIRLNTKFRDAIVTQYKADVADPELRMYTGKDRNTRKKFSDLYGADVKALAADPEKIINTMMQFEENNARMAAFGYGDRTSGTGPWSDPNFKAGQNVAAKGDPTLSDYQGNYVNKEARQIIVDNQAKDGKVNLSDIDFSKNELGQGTYISYRRALLNNPDFQGLASHKQTGVNDETVFDIQGQVSGIDRYSTNTTLEERLGYNLNPPPPETKPGEKNTFYCVEYSDGTKETKTVTYKEGEQPVAPSGEINGKTVTKATQYETADDATKNCGTPTKIPPPTKQPPQPDTWFAPDIVNYMTNERQIIPNTPPVLRQMNAAYSGYDTINPITRIAGTTGLVKQSQDLAMNTMDAQTAFTAGANQGFEQLSRDIADVEEGNTTKIVNPYLQTIGQLNTDVDYKNTMLRGKFDNEYATYVEELAGQRNKKDAQGAMLFGTGWGNVQKDNSLRVMYPNAWHAQRLSPTFAWSGAGKDPLAAVDTSVSPGTAATTQADCSKAYADAYAQVKNDTTMPQDAKEEYASNMQKACISQNMNRANAQTKTQQQMYGQNFIQQRFGGTMYTAPGSMEFGGVYFDDIY